jgi:hypothetical protein
MRRSFLRLGVAVTLVVVGLAIVTVASRAAWPPEREAISAPVATSAVTVLKEHARPAPLVATALVLLVLLGTAPASAGRLHTTVRFSGRGPRSPPHHRY